MIKLKLGHFNLPKLEVPELLNWIRVNFCLARAVYMADLIANLTSIWPFNVINDGRSQFGLQEKIAWASLKQNEV